MTDKNVQLKQKLFERIEMDHVCPRSRLFFRTRECFVWFLWFVSVVVGALAVGISLFVVTHSQYALYEATHENFFTFMVEVLPYLWFVTFAAMVIFAVYNVRKMKYGYRYPVWMIIASSVVVSFAGGSTLQFFGLGYTIDKEFGRLMPGYNSQEALEHEMWQNPPEGRLVGRLVAEETHMAQAIFRDRMGVIWELETTELMSSDRQLLEDGMKVRLLGVVTSTTSPTFYACGVYPWMFGRDVTTEDMSRERQAFLDRVYVKMERAEEELEGIEAEIAADIAVEFAPQAPRENVVACADIGPIQRFDKRNSK